MKGAVIVFPDLLLVGCGLWGSDPGVTQASQVADHMAQAEREQAEWLAKLQQELKIGMPIAEAEAVLGGPPFEVEFTKTADGFRESRYYNATYLSSDALVWVATSGKVQERPRLLSRWKPGEKILWLKGEDSFLTSWGFR